MSVIDSPLGTGASPARIRETWLELAEARSALDHRLAADLLPGLLEEPQQPLVVDGQDRQLAVLGGLDEIEAAVGDERAPDDPGPLHDLVGRDRHAEVDLVLDVVGALMVRGDGFHPADRSGGPAIRSGPCRSAGAGRRGVTLGARRRRPGSRVWWIEPWR